MRDLKSDPSLSGSLDTVLIWRDMDIDSPLPSTPSVGKYEQETCPISEKTILSIGEQYGFRPMSYANEKDGAIVHQIIPVRGREVSYSNEGSCQFPFHVEVPHDPNGPDYVALLCLKGQPNAVTEWVSMESIMGILSSRSRAALSREEFKLNEGVSFGTNKYHNVSVVRPDRFVLDLAEMTGTTRSAVDALEEIKMIIHLKPSLVESHILMPGDMILMNNRKVVHGRRGFPVNYDGNHRWLQRVYYKCV